MFNWKKIWESMQRTERASWLFIGGGLGLALGVWLDYTNNLNTATSVIAGLVLAIAVTQLGEAIRKGEIEEIIGVFNHIRHDKFLREKIDTLIEYYFIIRAYHNPLFDERLENEMIAFLDELSILKNGRLKLRPPEELPIAFTLNRNAKKVIKASSLSSNDTPEWWNSPEGKSYIAENRKLIEGDGRVIRVFLLHNDEVDKFKEVMAIQHQEGVDVYVGIIEDLPSYLVESYAIFDDSIVRAEKLLSGYEVSSTIYIKSEDVRRYISLFEDLIYRSREFDKLFFETEEHDK